MRSTGDGCRKRRQDARMRRPPPLPPELRGRAFTIAEARARGVSRAALAGPGLARPFKGARIPEHPDDASEPATLNENAIVRRARAFAPLLLPGQCFSHTTAAVILGLRLPSRFEEPVIHVMSTGGRRAPRRTGVVGHRGEPSVVSMRGLPVTAPVTTWLHCAETLTTLDLVVMGDGLVARQQPICSLADLETAVVAHGRRRGTASLRAALERIRPRTDSAMETVLRLLIVDAGLPEPVVNLPICDTAGAFVAFADLAWAQERVIVEYEGDQHRTDRAQFASDIERIGLLQQLGWFVIRVDSALLRASPRLIARLRAALASSRPQPPPASDTR